MKCERCGSEMAPSEFSIASEIDLGSVVLQRLDDWGFKTLGDLAKVGAFAQYEIPEAERDPKNWRTYLPPLMDLRGIGAVKILRIRLALRKHGLALADEDYIDRWQPLDVHDPPDDGT